MSLVLLGPQPGSDWVGCYPSLTFSGVLPFLMTRNAKCVPGKLYSAWCWVLVWRRNIREAFPGEVTVEWVLRDALEFTRFIGGVRG